MAAVDEDGSQTENNNEDNTVQNGDKQIMMMQQVRKLNFLLLGYELLFIKVYCK